MESKLDDSKNLTPVATKPLEVSWITFTTQMYFADIVSQQSIQERKPSSIEYGRVVN